LFAVNLSGDIMRNASRAAALTVAVSLGTMAATSSPVGAVELGPITVYDSSGVVTISNNSTNWYLFNFEIGNVSPRGAYVNALTTQSNWQAGVSTSLIGSNIWTVADYLSLGSLADDIGPREQSSNFYYYTDEVINLYVVNLVNATGENEHYYLSGTPEPSTWAMTLLGFAGLGFAALRRARNARLAMA
jgi:hypothetical protein